MPDRLMVAKASSDDVAFLIENGTFGLDGELALVGLHTRAFSKQESVISGYYNVMAIQVVYNIANNRSQFVNGSTHGLESAGFGLAVASGVDRVVVDVDNPLVFDKLAALLL